MLPCSLLSPWPQAWEGAGREAPSLEQTQCFPVAPSGCSCLPPSQQQPLGPGLCPPPPAALPGPFEGAAPPSLGPLPCSPLPGGRRSPALAAEARLGRYLEAEAGLGSAHGCADLGPRVSSPGLCPRCLMLASPQPSLPDPRSHPCSPSSDPLGTEPQPGPTCQHFPHPAGRAGARSPCSTACWYIWKSVASRAQLYITKAPLRVPLVEMPPSARSSVICGERPPGPPPPCSPIPSSAYPCSREPWTPVPWGRPCNVIPSAETLGTWLGAPCCCPWA